jgi:hypothetical protein
MNKYQSDIKGHVDIKVIEDSDEFEGKIETWQEILIHGDPEGLRSLAKLLIKIADTNQDEKFDIPIGAREHVHLRPKLDLSNSSNQVTIGRLDAKGTGEFYQAFIRKDAEV